MPRIRLILLLCLSSGAQAEDTLLGAALRSRPAYDGSRSQVTDLIPVVRYYGRPWFARSTQGMLEGGARATFASGLAIGAQVAYEAGPRSENPGASLGFHVEWDGRIGPVPVTLLGRYRERPGHEREEAADARLTAGIYQTGKAAAGVFTQATWASTEWVRSHYALGDAGLVYTSVGALGSYDLSKQWVAVGSVEARRLSSDLAASPFVQRRSGYYGAIGLAYRF